MTPAESPWLRTLALTCTLAATVFLLWQSDEPAIVQNDAADLRGNTEPDGFVVNGEYTSYDAQGNVKVHFTSPRIEQFEEGSVATIISPRAELFSDQASEPWIVEAENGSLLQNENILYLTGNVRVLRTTGERQATLATSSLTLDNDTGTVYTDAPVEITDATGVTRATGMKAWIDKRILELNSQVEGRYEIGH
ncbi:LPS export ABC transporter periplasmic protein LptC [Marinobacter salinexigens]|uniref:Lipopolysaccharide export system protein LptC n=1 Tax=Marinobacter salinexigens TaxID=2919747 RepID=A0A5B0VNM9_9GAMM|nr:LPS export ABC transporter periplasmic protein LptC [Marinobacter salinexigens]KAA1176360.1 LPS export ABC transporter periplasmic protein LptC [Marinobacter salinexigens]